MTKNVEKNPHKILELINKSIGEIPESFLYHTSPFQLLIAIMLSANCSDKRVNSVTPILFNLYPTSKSLSKADYDSVSKIIKPCGIWKNKTMRVIDTAKLIYNKYNGTPPNDKNKLKELSGVGEKTASVFLSQHYKDLNEFPVDRHIIRLANRWSISSSNCQIKVSNDLKKFFKGFNWRELHMKMIMFGRIHCKAYPRKCSCDVCILTNNKSQDQKL